MQLAEAMTALERAGNEQTKKTYLRHGAPEPTFGVKFADIYRLVKAITQDQALAEALWATGNSDARNLATRIADPATMSRKALDTWAKGLRYYVETDGLGALAARTPHARAVAEDWMESENEWIAAAGWTVVGALAATAEVGDDWLAPLLARIERSIAGAQNRVRHSMNGALISMGGHRPSMREAALKVARKIGRVEVDHGETSCMTPDAAAYIATTAARNPPPQVEEPAPAKAPPARAPLQRPMVARPGGGAARATVKAEAESAVESAEAASARTTAARRAAATAMAAAKAAKTAGAARKPTKAKGTPAAAAKAKAKTSAKAPAAPKRSAAKAPKSDSGRTKPAKAARGAASAARSSRGRRGR